MAKKIRRILSLTLVLVMMSTNTIALAVGPIDDYRCNHETDACYQMVLNCEKHVHDDSCGDPCDQEVLDLICTKEEHIHDAEICDLHVCTPECSSIQNSEDANEALECDKEEHAHSEECMTLVCGKDEYAHAKECMEIDCGKEEHAQTEECPVDCDKELHAHSEECMKLVCDKVEHAHSEECMTVCDKEEHSHAEDTNEVPECDKEEHSHAEDTNEAPECDKEEHAHSEECMTMMVDAVKCTKEWDCELEEHTHDDTCYAPHQHTDACMTRGDLICTLGDLPDDLVAVDSATSGIVFNLYNYNSNINLIEPVDGKASKDLYTLLSKYFNFGGGGDTNSTTTVDPGQLGPNHLTYERNLGEDGAPVITWASVNYESELEGTDVRSIGYLFGTGDGHFAVTEYENILTVPLVYNPETGYYVYESSENAVDYDEETNMVYIRGYVDQGKASADANIYFDDDDKLADFFPFNSRLLVDEEGNVIGFVQDSEDYVAADGTNYHYDTTTKTELENPDYWFGASMNASFYYPQDGYLNGDQMIYQFTGDDDVMVYIDGILTMDLGGAHSRASGEINFATGLVETWLDAGNQPKLNDPDGTYDHKEWAEEAAAAESVEVGEDGYYYAIGADGERTLIRYYPTTIYDSYKAAYKESGMTDEQIEIELAKVFVPVYNSLGGQEMVTDAYGFEHPVYRFRDYSTHDFDWFYMERHAWEANFSTQFNLPTIPQNSLTIEKVVEDTEDLVDDDALYAFEVWATDKDGNPCDLITTVELKAGESCVINDMIQGTKADDADDHFGYVVKELGQVLIEVIDGVETKVYSLDGYTVDWAVGDENLNPESFITAELSAENSQVVIFTNRVTSRKSEEPEIIVPEEPEIIVPEVPEIIVPEKPVIVVPEIKVPEIKKPEIKEPVVEEPVIEEPVIEEIPDEEIPLVTEPIEKEIPDDAIPLTDIPDEPVPLTGDSFVWYISVVLAGIGLIALSLSNKKRNHTTF